jgi:hypothetical protein
MSEFENMTEPEDLPEADLPDPGELLAMAGSDDFPSSHTRGKGRVSGGEAPGDSVRHHG